MQFHLTDPNKQVYSYRKGGVSQLIMGLFVIAFILFMWIQILDVNRRMGGLPISHEKGRGGIVTWSDHGYPEDIQPLSHAWPFFVFGLGFMSIGVWLIMSYIRERIEVTPDRIVWIDWLGRERVNSPLKDITGNDVIEGQRGLTSYVIETTHGKIKFSSRISGCQALQKLAERHVTEHFRAEPPRYHEFTYRRGVVLGQAIMGMACALIVIPLYLDWDKPYVRSIAWLALFGNGAFVAFGIYALLKYLNERITLTKDRLLHVDWQGRQRISVPLTSGIRIDMNGPSGTIYTASGKIRVSSFIKDGAELKPMLESAIEHAKSGDNQ